MAFREFEGELDKSQPKSFTEFDGELDKPEEKGFFSNVGTLLKEGGESAIAAARLSGDVATGDFDPNAAELISQQLNIDQSSKPKEYQEVTESFAKISKEGEEAGKFTEHPLDNLAVVGKMIFNVGEQAVTNPKGLAYLTASQIANMAPAIAGMMAGAKVGAVTGGAAGSVVPVLGTAAGAAGGAVAGGIAGGFFGEWPMEAGSEFVGLVGKELSARKMEPTEGNVSALLADKAFMDTAVSQARTKATTTAAIDSAITMGAGRMVGAPARAAEKAARLELGAAATAAEVTARAGEIVAKRTALQKAANVGKAVGVDVAGGGLSEAGGQIAAYGEADLGDVGMEMLGELGGAGIEVPGAAWSAARGEVKPTLNPTDILDQNKSVAESIDTATQIVDDALDIQGSGLLDAEPIQEVQDGAINVAPAGPMDTGSIPVAGDIAQGSAGAGILGADDGAIAGTGIAGDTSAPMAITGQDQPVPAGGDAAVTFTTPHEDKLTQHYQKATQAGITKEQADIFMPAEDLDHVTGFYRGEEKAPTVKRAQEFVDKTGQTAHFVDADIANLGGINAHFNNNAEQANKVYRGLSDIFKAEMEKAGSKAVMIRQGGDEISAVVIGGTEVSIKRGISETNRKSLEYAKSMGLSEIPYGKAKGDTTPYGTGIYLGFAEIKPGRDMSTIFDVASVDLNEGKKKGVNYVNRIKSGEAGAGTLAGQAGGIPAGAGTEAQGAGQPAGAAGQGLPAAETKPAKAVKKSPKSHTLLTAIRNMGGLSLNGKGDVVGDKFALGGYNQIFRKDANSSIEGLVGKGELDEFLPYELRFATNDQPGAEVADMQEAAEYIKDKIRSGERVIPYDAQMELEQKEINAQALIDAVEEELSYDEINAQLQLATNEEREDATNARIFEPIDTQGGAERGQGAEEGKGADTNEQAFSLESQTNAEIAAKEARAQDTSIEDKAAADRAAEVPFTLSAQSQEKPAGAQAGMFTPDGRATVAAEAKPGNVKRGDEVNLKITGNVADIYGIYAANTGTRLYERTVRDLGQKGVKTINVHLQSADSQGALKDLIDRNILENPRNIKGSQYPGVGYPTTFDIADVIESKPTAEAAKAAFFAQPTTETNAAENSDFTSFKRAAETGKLHQATGKALPGEDSAINPVEMGRINGYPDADIMHFYAYRRGYGKEGNSEKDNKVALSSGFNEYKADLKDAQDRIDTWNAPTGNKTPEAAKAKKLEVTKAQAKGKVTGDQAAALKELADAGEHAAVDEVLKPEVAKETTAESYADRVHTLDVQDDVIERAIGGEITADEFKASFEALLNNKDGIKAELSAMTKPQIFKRLPGIEYRYKSEKKDAVVDAAYRDMISSFTLGESYSYGMGRDSMINSIRALVEKTTDETLAKFAEDVKKSRAERAEKRKEVAAGIENPQTLDDFNNLMNSKAQEVGEGATFAQVRMMLTPEQRARFDELAAEKSRAERASRKVAQQEQTMRAPGEAVETTDIVKTKHTKHGHDLWQFQMVQRISADEFKALAGQAKRLGGDYSSYRGNGAIPGWQFRTEEAAKAFKALIAGDTTQAKEVAQTRRDAYVDDHSQSSVERLNEMADALEEKANASLNQDRKENTARRARFAASAEASANSDKALAGTMRNIAQAIEDGSAKMLDKVRQKVQVETLRGFVNTAFSEQQREMYPEYADRERHRGEKPTAEAADYAKYPSYTAFRSDLANLGRSLSEVDGTMKLGQRLMKVADDISDAYLKFAKENLTQVSTFQNKSGGMAAFTSKAIAEEAIRRSDYKGMAIVLPVKRNENLIILSPSEAIKRGIWQGDNDKRISLSADFGAELVEKIGKVARRGAKVSVPWQFENAYDSRKRLAGMGIETPAELRTALREFISLREVPAEADKVKQLERAMIGRSNDGMDFFPTPAGAADEMIEAADIKEGMSVLEPSAGMGHIADRIRESGVEPDVVELSGSRRELLEAKGYNLVGSDFMDVTGESYDRILMNPPFGDRRDAEHVKHAFSLLKPGGRLVSIMGEGVFFGKDKKAQEFRGWLESVGGTDEKLAEGTFLDPSLPVNTGVAARMVVIDKPSDDAFSRAESLIANPYTESTLKAAIDQAYGKNFAGQLLATGKFSIIESKDLEQYLGEGVRFSKTAQTPLSRKEFDKLYIAQHKDIASKDKDATKQSILSEGLRRGFNVNALPVYKGGLPTNITDKRYGNKTGDRIYLLRKAGVKDGPNGYKTVEGYKPETEDIIDIKNDYESSYDAYLRNFDNQSQTDTPDNNGQFDPSNPDIRYSAEGRILAFVKEGHAYFVADNISADDNIKGLVAHELGLHALQLGRNDIEFRDILKQIDKMKESGNQKVIDAFNRVPKDTPAHLVTEEAAGYLIEKHPELSISAKLLAWFRATLRAIGKKLPVLQRAKWFEWAAKLSTDDIVQMAVSATRSAPETLAGNQRKGDQLFSTSKRVVSDLVKVFQSLKEVDDTAIYPLSDKKDMQDIASDLDPKIKIEHIGISPEYYVDEDGVRALRDKWDNWRMKSIDGKAAYITANLVTREIKVNVSELREGGSAGSLIYQMVGQYAANNDMVFVGDEDGLSNAAMYRRTENMISLAIKLGTTKFMRPHPDQLKAYNGQRKGEDFFWPGMEWVEGDSESNLHSMLMAAYSAVSHHVPEIKNVIYDTNTSNFRNTRTGQEFTDEDFRALADTGASRSGHSGRTTLKRAALANSVLSGQLSEAEWNKSLVGIVGDKVGGDTRGESLNRIRYSKAQGNLPLEGGETGDNSTWGAPEPTFLDDVIYKLQDKNIDLKRAIESIKATGKQISNSFNTYLQEELFHERSAKRVKDFNKKELKPLIEEMRMRGLEVEELDNYLWARHAKEANALIAERDPKLDDGGSGLTNQQADDYFAGKDVFDRDGELIMKGLDAKNKPRLDAVAKRVDAILGKTRELYASYGLVSRDQVDSWGQMFEHYVPLMREDNDGAMGVGQGFSIKGKEVKHRTGSTAKVVDILANIALQREKAIVRGEKNRVAVSLAGLVKLNPNPEFWSLGAIAERRFNETTGLVEFQINGSWKNRDNVIVAKIKDEKGQVHERGIILNERNERALRMAESMKNLDMAQLGGFLGTSAVFTRYFASINTQWNPVFGITNLVRDVQGMALNLDNTALAKHKLEVMKHIPGAIKGIYLDSRSERKGVAGTSNWSQLWEELQDEGGMTGYRDLYRNSEDRANAIKHELDPHNWVNSKWGKVFTAGGALKVPLTKAQDMAGPLFDWLSDYNQTLEGATRLSVYKVAIDSGMSKPEAASLAKNITVNFNRKGQAGQQAGALYAFFNAAMQGTARIGQTIFDMDKGDIKTLRLNATGKKIVYGGVLLGSMQAVMLAAAGFGDDDPPEFVRERSLIIPIPFGDKKYISIPMPLGFHVLPNLGRIPTEFAMNGFKKPTEHVIRLMSVFVDAFNPIGSAGMSLQTIAPTMLDPLAALAENRDWTGKPIAKARFDSTTPGFAQNKDTATGISKLVAEGINYLTGGDKYTAGKFSPTADQLDYLAGQFGGGVWREGAKLEQFAVSTVTGEEMPTYKTPLLGRFYGNAASQASQGAAYYSSLQRIHEVKAGLEGRLQDKLPTEEFKRDNPDYRMIGRAKLAEQTIAKLRKTKRELIERGAERERVKAVEDRITTVMKQFNDSVVRFEMETAQ